jgi:hypothetical protein
MNCELINQTSLPALLYPYRDPKGRTRMLLITKSTWRIDSGRLAPAEQQIGIFLRPQTLYLGDLDLHQTQRQALDKREAEEVVWLDHDLVPPKPVFDLLVAGYVTPPDNHHKPKIEASVRIGNHQSTLEAHVPRYWKPGLINHTPEPLSKTLHRVPISYALADWSAGFPLEPESEQMQLLPWLQRPGVTCRRKRHDMHPAGFGYWPENAEHRKCYSGTYDEAWQWQRMPDLPDDFNDRFFNVAHPELQLMQTPAPGMEIELTHLSETPRLSFGMPHLSLVAQVTTLGGNLLPPAPLRPDTLTIEPDQSRMSLIQRTTLNMGDGEHAIGSIRLIKPRKQIL